MELQSYFLYAVFVVIGVIVAMFLAAIIAWSTSPNRRGLQLIQFEEVTEHVGNLGLIYPAVVIYVFAALVYFVK